MLKVEQTEKNEFTIEELEEINDILRKNGFIPQERDPTLVKYASYGDFLERIYVEKEGKRRYRVTYELAPRKPAKVGEEYVKSGGEVIIKHRGKVIRINRDIVEEFTNYTPPHLTKYKGYSVAMVTSNLRDIETLIEKANELIEIYEALNRR